MHLLFLELFFWIACTLLLMSAVAISDDVAAMRMGWMDERTDWMNGCVCVSVLDTPESVSVNEVHLFLVGCSLCMDF